MTHLLTSLAQGKIAILLEGGYDLSSTSYSMMMCAKALLGDPLPTPNIGIINPVAVETINRVIAAQRPFWSCLQFSVDLPDSNVLCPPWITDPKIFNNNQNLLMYSNDVKLKTLSLHETPFSDSDRSKIPLSTHSIEYPKEPLTVDDFLSLPEMVEVFFASYQKIQQVLQNCLLYRPSVTVRRIVWCLIYAARMSTKFTQAPILNGLLNPLA